jgi:hypothetical protein
LIINTTRIKKFANMRRKIALIRTTPAANLIGNSGVASEKELMEEEEEEERRQRQKKEEEEFTRLPEDTT